MAGRSLTPTLERHGAWTRVAGRFWRAVPVGADVLAGTVRPGRYNRPGERTLYASASPDGVAAAMRRYGDRDRDLVALAVEAERLVDLRDASACATLGIDTSGAAQDWVSALARDETPRSWIVADQARAAGAAGLLDPSRTAPGRWHLVLFVWGPEVRIVPAG